MLEEQITTLIQERTFTLENENFILAVASLIEDIRFLFAILDNYMNVEISSLKSKLITILIKRDQAFTHAK